MFARDQAPDAKNNVYLNLYGLRTSEHSRLVALMLPSAFRCAQFLYGHRSGRQSAWRFCVKLEVRFLFCFVMRCSTVDEQAAFVRIFSAQEVTVGPAPHLVYRAIGGRFEIFFLPGNRHAVRDSSS